MNRLRLRRSVSSLGFRLLPLTTLSSDNLTPKHALVPSAKAISMSMGPSVPSESEIVVAFSFSKEARFFDSSWSFVVVISWSVCENTPPEDAIMEDARYQLVRIKGVFRHQCRVHQLSVLELGIYTN